MRRTKIVCTIGPATDGPDHIARLIAAGMDVARLNCSHGSLADHIQRLQWVRQAEAEAGRAIGVLLDIQGPKIRIGDIPGGELLLSKGDSLTLTVDPHDSSSEAIFVGYPRLADDVQPGSVLFLDDGLIELRVVSVSGSRVLCVVICGGELRPRKGVTLPGVSVDLPALGERDLEHINFAAQHGCDFIAASFVRRAEHVMAAGQAIAASGSRMQVIAKIESGEGVQNMGEILAAADGVMVARGDMGVELPPEDVPLVQKRLIERCNVAGKPVITATQMLESMIRNPRPTRAEVTDVANAILDGTDAVMLSGETAIGRYPAEAVGTMHRIACRTEEATQFSEMFAKRLACRNTTVAEAIARSTCQTAGSIDAAAILCFTQSGATARLVSKYRPRAPIIALTPNIYVARQLTLTWGVYPLVVARSENTDHMIDVALDAARNNGLVSAGDIVAIAAAVRTGTPGRTNMLQVQEVVG